MKKMKIQCLNIQTLDFLLYKGKIYKKNLYALGGFMLAAPARREFLWQVVCSVFFL